MVCTLGFVTTDCATATGNVFGDDNTVVLNKIDPKLIALTGATDQHGGPTAATHVFVAEDNALASATSVNLVLTDAGQADTTFGAGALAYGASDNTYALLVGNAFSSTALPDGRVQGELFRGARRRAHRGVRLRTRYGQCRPMPVVIANRWRSVQSSQVFYAADTFNLWSTVDEGQHIIASTLPTNFTRPTSVEFIDNNGVEALLVGGLSSIAYAQSPILVADSDPTGDLGSWRPFGSGLPNALVYQMSYNPQADVLAIASVGRGVWTLYDVTSYFPQAKVLKFGLADDDSAPDATYLIDGTHLDGTTFVRPLNKYGTGTLTIAGNASYTGGTSIFGGVLQLGAGGASGSIPGEVSFCSDATDPLCHASIDKFLVFDRSDTYTFAGAISGPGQLVQNGPGTTILTGVSTYTGPSFVNSGVLNVKGSIVSSVFVNAGATLVGTGKVGSTTVNAAGTLLPGDSVGTVGTLKVAGDLLLMPGSSYLTTVLGSTASRTHVSGVATLAGSELSLFEPGSLINSYTILSAGGGRSGTFDMFTAIGLPSFVSAALGYTATDVTLDLTSQIAGSMA